MDIINAIFPRQLNLKDSKRLETEEDKNTTREIKKIIFKNFKKMEREMFIQQTNMQRTTQMATHDRSRLYHGIAEKAYK